MANFESVAALKMYGRSFKADLLEHLVLHSPTRKNLEKFLGVKIASGKTTGTYCYKQRDYIDSKYRRRIFNTKGEITPAWEMFVDTGDHVRTREDHLEKITQYQETLPPLGILEDSEAISASTPDPQSVTAVLNIIHSINPGLCEFTKVSGNPWKNLNVGHSRKKTGKFVRGLSGKRY